jgi:hypothetical protein
MTLMLSEVYDALIEAGASDEKARNAATAIAKFEQRFNNIERRLVIVSWQIGALTAVTAAVGAPALWVLFRVAAKVGALG